MYMHRQEQDIYMHAAAAVLMMLMLRNPEGVLMSSECDVQRHNDGRPA